MISWILYGVAAVCLLGAIQERKDFMRMFGFVAVAAVFGIVGLAISIM